MLIAPWLFVTAMLAGGSAQSAQTADVTPPAPVVDQGSSSSSSSSSSGSGSAPNHLVGFGGEVGAGGLGTGLGLRYWFAGFLGLDMRFLLSSAETGIVTNGGFSFEAAPSLIVMLAKPDSSQPVNFRPYIGAGINHARAGANITSRSPVSGNGTQVFGGVEVTIQQVGALAISGEVIYNKRPQALEAAGVDSGVTGVVSFLFYVK
jgi:opacity protein-like surface antigen